MEVHGGRKRNYKHTTWICRVDRKRQRSYANWVL